MAVAYSGLTWKTIMDCLGLLTNLLPSRPPRQALETCREDPLFQMQACHRRLDYLDHGQHRPTDVKGSILLGTLRNTLYTSTYPYIYILYIVCVNNCFKLLSEPKITQTHGSCPRAMGMHNCCFGTLGNWRISENSTAEIPWCANPNGQLGNEPNVAKRGQTIKTQQSHRVGHFSFSFPPASPIFEATHDQTSSPICAFPHRLPCLPIAPGGWTQSTD